MIKSRIASLLFLLCLIVPSLQQKASGATVSISIGMGIVVSNGNTKVGTDALFQLIDLGIDKVFNPVVEGNWTGGDDEVIDVTFSNLDGWTTTAAFDLANGVGTAGEFTRVFTLTLNTAVYSGQSIGIRWFPTVRAQDYSATVPAAGLTFGQFTRQSSPLYGGNAWIVPNEGDLVSFDPLVTQSYDAANGLDPNSLGFASSSIAAIPEPNTAGLVLTGYLLLFRFWRCRVRHSTVGNV